MTAPPLFAPLVLVVIGFMRFAGTSEDEIIAVLDKHSSAQRQEISEVFKSSYGQVNAQ